MLLHSTLTFNPHPPPLTIAHAHIIKKGTQRMKFILASIAALTLTAPAFAAPTCWQAKGNWVGGESFTNCNFVSGHNSYSLLVKEKRTKPETKDE